jgi:hypothetical protein
VTPDATEYVVIFAPPEGLAAAMQHFSIGLTSRATAQDSHPDRFERNYCIRKKKARWGGFGWENCD